MNSQGRTYRDVFTLMREEPEARLYFEKLPATVREQMSTHAFRINSMNSMRSYAENLTHNTQ
ncbi:MAG TPA: hypothetical protein DHW78_02280 [Ruminococcaceae bacterium]|jgi:hypothetical protein|nr:hypothetical protein [Oscillospiraceae bacterium]HCM23146.1 hypothetical protein [Oscillospiraceae bacterium]